jgi:hypothetical protein
MRPSEIANAIKPFVLGWIKDVSSNSGSSGGAGTGVAVHDFLGPYHTRPSLSAGQFLASPAAATGLPDFRSIALSDIQSVADTRYALAGRLINAGGGLTGGGALTADVTIDVGAGTGITVGADAVNVNQGFAFSWSASHAFGAGLTVSGANTITFGGDVTLSRSTADLLALGANDSIGTASFTSGFAGSGWRVNYAVATGYSAEVDNLVVRQQMRVYELLIQKIRSGNGSYLFAPGGKVSAVTGGPTYTLTFDTDHGLASNGTTQKDLVRAQKFDLGLGGVYTSVLQIESIISTTQLTATVISGAVPAVGYEYVRFGNTGDTNRQGGVYVTADDTNAPYIDVFDGVTSSADWQSTTKTKVRLGKLNGITDALFGALTGYGLYTQSGYFTGGIRATSGRIDGVLDIGTGGGIFQGTGTFATPTTGLKIWNDGGVGRMGGWSAGAPQWSINTSGQFVAGTVSYSGGYGSAQTDDRLRISASGVRFGVLPFVDNGHTIKHIEWANGITYVGKATGPLPYFNTYLDEPFESGVFQTSWAYWDTHARWALNGAEIELISDVKSSLGVREEYIIMRGARVRLETALAATSGILVGTATGAGAGDIYASGVAQLGSTANSYAPNVASNLLLNSSGTSSITFHDSGDTFGHLTFSAAEGFRIGGDWTGFGAKGVSIGAATGAGPGQLKTSGGANIGDTINGTVDGGIQLGRASTSEPFVQFANNSGTNKLGQMRGVNGGGLRFTNGDASVQWATFDSSGNFGVDGNLTGSSWSAATYDASWLTSVTAGSPQALSSKKFGDVVFVRGRVRRTGTGQTIGTLVSGHRPSGSIYRAAVSHDGSGNYASVILRVQSSGVITIEPTPGTNPVDIDCSMVFSVNS